MLLDVGWDREPTATAWESFATRMTTADRSRSLAPAGTREGLFRVVYRFKNEQLLELVFRCQAVPKVLFHFARMVRRSDG